MKVLFFIFVLLISMSVMAQDQPVEEVADLSGFEFSVAVGAENPVVEEAVVAAPVEKPDSYLDFFGISLEMFAILSAVLFFLIEGIKRKLPNVFTGSENKWRTDILLGVLSVLLALKVFYPDPATIVACAIGLFIGGSGIHAFKKSIFN